MNGGLVLPHPYEGIYGTDRTGMDLLSLKIEARPHRDALVAMGRLLRQVTSVGAQPPIVAALWERMHTPVPGDLVIEVTRLRPTPDERLRGFGYLLAARTEWTSSDPEWDAHLTAVAAVGGPPPPRAAEPAWYVQYGPGPDEVARWTAAGFVVLPVTVTSRWLEEEVARKGHPPRAGEK